MKDDLIGKSVPRIDGVEKVTGSATFTADIKLPGMLYAKMLLSPHAHAKIVSIDIERAKGVPGVKAVLTGKDLPYRVGLYMVDKPILADGKVRYCGEPVAAVAATSEEVAQEAVSLIKVKYEVLEPVLDAREAIKPEAPLVHEFLHTYDCVKGVFCPIHHTNVANHFRLRKGDVEAGFAKSHKAIENTFYAPQVQHAPLETHASIGHWKPSGAIEIWTSAQSPFAVRHLLSVALDISQARIRVMVPNVGGAFGGKAGIHLEPLVVMLSKFAGFRPVRLVATRTEEFITLPCRQGLHSRIKTGVTREGRIVAEEIEYVWDAGAYADYGVNIGRASGYSGAGPYDIDNVKIDSLTVYTTKPFGTAYRGFGHVEMFWAIESQMDMVARDLGMDPLEFRMINLLRPGSTTITGEKITEHTGNVRKCLEEVAKAIDWDGRGGGSGNRVRGDSGGKGGSGGKLRGKGLAVLHKAPAMPPNTASSAIIRFNEDATANVMVSGVDYGQGTATALSQVAAYALRLPFEKIHFVWGRDTEYGPYDWQTVASRLTVMGSLCIMRAAEDALSQMKAVAAQALGVSRDDLEVDDGRVFVTREPARALRYEDLVLGYKFPNGNSIGGPVVGRGSYVAEGLTNLDTETGQGLPALNWTYGAHAVEIEIDPATGDIEIMKLVSAFDVGRVINDALARAQVIGGGVQGIGTALAEEYRYDDKGHLLNSSFTDYKILTAKDIPREMIQIFVETPHDKGPFGARGVAEHPMISVPTVIGNALFDATGLRIHELPLSPERVFLALRAEPKTGS
ncbi:MAG: xanthine dehydrogenase family protein molybdopterin-binding subunit [Candidatus Eisenbacteria bacterium]